MNKYFKIYERKMNMKYIRRREVDLNGVSRRVTPDDRRFLIPENPNQKMTLRWTVKSPTRNGYVPREYTVKHTLRKDKVPDYPRRMWIQKRQFQLRRDGQIALADATFQSKKPPADPFYEYKEIKVPEMTEKELRNMDEYQGFFMDWDDGGFNEENCVEIMTQSINKRVETYQDIYKDTSNPIYLAQAVFLKFLDFKRLSTIHKMYLMLAEECGFPMCYVEGILRLHYE